MSLAARLLLCTVALAVCAITNAAAPAPVPAPAGELPVAPPAPSCGAGEDVGPLDAGSGACAAAGGPLHVQDGFLDDEHLRASLIEVRARAAPARVAAHCERAPARRSAPPHRRIPDCWYSSIYLSLAVH